MLKSFEKRPEAMMLREMELGLIGKFVGVFY